MKIIKYVFSRIKENIEIIKCGGRNNYILKTLRDGGAFIGEKVQLYSQDIFIDPTRPWLLNIGSYTKITHHVIILTHDYSLSVLRRKYGEWIGEGKETTIGENCFIGMGSIILMGAKIGNNCIVGAGSVVRGEFPDDSVIVGNPAKVVCSLDEYYYKRKKATIQEAKGCVLSYEKHMKKSPAPEDLGGFKFLYAPRDKSDLKRNNLNFNCTGDNASEVEQSFFFSLPYWNSFEDMLRDARDIEE